MNTKEQLNNIETTTPRALPLPTLPAVQAFNLEVLPNSIKDYVIDVADRQQSPPDFIAVVTMCALSAILGRKVLIRPKQHDDWTVVPNLWGTIIGRPSAMKSPSMREALKPLLQIESQSAKKYETALKQYMAEKELAEIDKDIAKQTARQMSKGGDREGALKTLANSKFDNSPPTRNRLVVNDATIEKLGELLNENPNGLILVRDELSGWVSKLSKEEFQSDRAFYLECFDGNGKYTYDRIGRGTIEIKNCTLSIVGGIQPSKLRVLLRDALNGIADDGLLQRLQLVVWPDDKATWAWKDREPNQAARTKFFNAFFQLHELNFDSINGESHYFHFTPEAQILYIEWLENIHFKARSEDTCPALESYLLKLPQTIASIALIIELVDGGRKAISETSMRKALKWAEYLISHAERLYSVFKNECLERAHLILKRKNKLSNPFTVREIARKEWSGFDGVKSVIDALEYLIDYNIVYAIEVPSSDKGGRPTMQYYWN